MLLTAAIIAAAAYAKRNDGEGGEAAGESEGSPQDIDALFIRNKASIDLLPLEQTLVTMEHPINTVSFYSVSPSCDIEGVVKKLERRVHEILKANPWLGGWYVKGFKNGSFDTSPRVWYDTFGDEKAPNLFQTLSAEDVPLTSFTPYLDYEKILRGTNALVKTNPRIVNRKEESMFRVTAIVGNSELALVVSMSHICGDGHTYYRVHNMLLGEPITAMIPERELRYSEKVMDLMGRQEAHYISHITTDPAWAKLLRMTSAVEEDPGSELHMRAFVVNRHWVGNLKAAHLSEGTFTDITKSIMRSPMANPTIYQKENSQNPTQSTNDIIVSWFWSLVKPNVGLMTVNMRGRIDIVSEDHAGNYHNPVPYTLQDYTTPTMIRESLASCRRAGRVPGSNMRTELPHPSSDLTFSIISNWACFRPPTTLTEEEEEQEEDNLPWNSEGVSLIRHLPIMFPEKLTKIMPKRMSCLVIFSCGNEDIGCVLMAPGKVMDEIDSCGIVQETIAEF